MVIGTIAGARSISWLFGYDDEVKAWSIHNRPLIAVVLFLSAVIYGMAKWLEEPTP
jgi:uncharacterized membrane protein